MKSLSSSIWYHSYQISRIYSFDNVISAFSWHPCLNLLLKYHQHKWVNDIIELIPFEVPKMVIIALNENLSYAWSHQTFHNTTLRHVSGHTNSSLVCMPCFSCFPSSFWKTCLLRHVYLLIEVSIKKCNLHIWLFKINIFNDNNSTLI